MSYNPNILLGRILKTQGYDGTLTVKLVKDFIENISSLETVFLEIEGKPVPFFISSYEYTGGDILRIRLEWYGSMEKVAGFTGCRVLLKMGDEEGRAPDDNHDITGFKVIQKNRSIIGDITEIITSPGQDLLKIVTPGKKEILIPFHEDFIIRINKKKRTLTVQLPDGLTDIN